MSENVTFVHLTDLHVADPAVADPGLHSNTNETLLRVKSMVMSLDPRPSFVVASGDLTNRGDVESFKQLRRLMADIDVPVIYALGNHDTRPGFYTGMLDRNAELDAPYFHDQVIDGIHIITLDSSEPGKIGGSIEPEQFDFIAQALDRHPELPKLIVVHHAPALDDDPGLEWESLTYRDSVRLAGMLKGRSVVGILSGHIHYDRVSHWNGIPVVVGTGQHCAMDILHTAELRMVNGASFALCTLRPSGLTVSFVPLPSDRRELVRHSYERLRNYTSAAAE